MRKKDENQENQHALRNVLNVCASSENNFSLELCVLRTTKSEFLLQSFPLLGVHQGQHEQLEVGG
jgi:hypothetical protein